MNERPIVIARSIDRADMAAVYEPRSAETVVVDRRPAERRLGETHLARGTVFLEVFAADVDAAAVAAREVLLSWFWNHDVYPVAPA